MSKSLKYQIFKATGILFILLSGWKIVETYQIDKERALFEGALLATIAAYYGFILQHKKNRSPTPSTQKLDSNFSKTSDEKLSITLNQNLSLPKDLTRLKQYLSQDSTSYATGLVKIDNTSYPALFIPFTQSYQGSIKLYSRVIFSSDDRPEIISQTLVDRISEKVCQQIKETLVYKK